MTARANSGTPSTFRPGQVHKVKCWPADFEAMRLGIKTADARRCDDRKYRVGDILEQQEWDPATEKYSGRILRQRVTYIERMAGPRMFCAVGNVGADDVVPMVILFVHNLST